MSLDAEHATVFKLKRDLYWLMGFTVYGMFFFDGNTHTHTPNARAQWDCLQVVDELVKVLWKKPASECTVKKKRPRGWHTLTHVETWEGTKRLSFSMNHQESSCLTLLWRVSKSPTAWESAVSVQTWVMSRMRMSLDGSLQHAPGAPCSLLSQVKSVLHYTQSYPATTKQKAKTWGPIPCRTICIHFWGTEKGPVISLI